MIERAAGRASGQVPRPPAQPRWAVPWCSRERTPNSAADRARPVRSATDRMSSDPLATKSVKGMTSDVAGTVSSVFAEADDGYRNTPGSALPQQDSGSDADQPFLYVVKTRGASRVLPSPRLDQQTSTTNDLDRALTASNAETEESTLASETPAAVDESQVLVSARVSPRRPAIHATETNSSRSDLPRAAQEAAEPAVEVHIGRVEVRLDVPQTPAPRPVSLPNGFAEFEAIRRYAAGPWPSRRR